jgi:NADH-quinone oxidoreductase subunit L
VFEDDAGIHPDVEAEIEGALAEHPVFGEVAAAAFEGADAGGKEVPLHAGLVTFIGQFGRFSGLLHRELDENALNDGFDGVSAGLRGTGLRYSRGQTGDAHGYLRTLAIGFVLLVVVLILGGAR